MDFKNDKEEIQVVRMPKIIEKVPDQLPPEITSLCDMFFNALKFNQEILNWNTSNVTTMWAMFYNATTFNKNISK